MLHVLHPCACQPLSSLLVFLNYSITQIEGDFGKSLVQRPAQGRPRPNTDQAAEALVSIS